MNNESQPNALITCLGKDESCDGCYLAEYADSKGLDADQKADLRRAASLAGECLWAGDGRRKVTAQLERDMSLESRLPEDAPFAAVEGYLAFFENHSSFK